MFQDLFSMTHLLMNGQSWQDYSIGDIVQYKQYYYVAKGNISGTAEFLDTGFQILDSKPQQQLIPNLDYKARQFADFYDLDSDNFDTEQQRLAQHLIDTPKRKYPQKILSMMLVHKFFQGMIPRQRYKKCPTKLLTS